MWLRLAGDTPTSNHASRTRRGKWHFTQAITHTSLAKCTKVPRSCSAEVDETREMGSMIKREVLTELKGHTK